ncbi:hypothetical protein [Nostoc sp.]|uniref:hypothetical protein n=1 Tax=Nostoc sp. TaxID=1180 RepID=UPI002FF4CE6F
MLRHFQPAARSLLFFADPIQKPSLIGQDANNPRVKQSKSDRMDVVLPDQKIGCNFLRSRKSFSQNI